MHYITKYFTFFALSCSVFSSECIAAVFTVGTGENCTHASLRGALVASLQNGPMLDEIRLTSSRTAMATPVVNQSVRLVGGFLDCALSSLPISRTSLQLDPNALGVFLKIDNTLVDRQKVELINLTIYSQNLAFSRPTSALHIRGNVAVELRSSIIENQFSGAIFIGHNDSTLVRPSLLISRSTMVANRSERSGAAIECSRADITIDQSEILDNQAAFNGGGLDLLNCSYQQLGSRFENNKALGAFGGAIHAFSSTLNFSPYFDPKTEQKQALLFKNNYARRGGGGIALTFLSNATGVDLALEGNETRGNGSALFLTKSSAFLDRSNYCNDYRNFSSTLCADISANKSIDYELVGSDYSTIALSSDAYLKMSRFHLHNNGSAAPNQGVGTTALFSVAGNSIVSLENSLVANNKLSLFAKILPFDANDSSMISSSFVTMVDNDYSRGIFQSSIEGLGRVKLNATILEEQEPIFVNAVSPFDSNADCTMSLNPINTIANTRGWLGSAQLDNWTVVPFYPSYKPLPGSPAIDFCRINPIFGSGGDFEKKARSVDRPDDQDLFGWTDLGAFELPLTDLP